MKTKQLKYFIIITITGLGLLSENCTNRQVSSSGKVENPKTSGIQNAERQQTQNSNSRALVQNQSSSLQKQIIIHYDNSNQYYRSIEFKNATDPQKTTFDIINSNPYNQKKFTVHSKGSEGDKRYVLKNNELIEFQPDKSYLLRQLNYNNLQEAQANSNTYVYQSSGNYIIVAYNFYVYENYDILIGVQSEINVFSDRGEIVKKFENIPLNCWEPIITNDGNYLCYSFGGKLDEGSDDLIKSGYRVFDIKNNKLVEEEFIEEGYYLQGKSIEHGMLHLLLTGNEGKNKYIVYNFQDREVYYSRDYISIDLAKFKEIRPDGFVFGVTSANDSNTKIELYKKNFKVKTLSY